MTDFSIFEAAVTAGQIALCAVGLFLVLFIVACGRNGRRYDEAIGADVENDREQMEALAEWNRERAVRAAQGA